MFRWLGGKGMHDGGWRFWTHAGASQGATRAQLLGELLFEQQQWQLRKVQTHQLQEGNYSTVKVSIDCVPQDFPALRYALKGPQARGDEARLIVPVTYMEKGVLRQFDMRGPSGEALPVIGRSEYRELMLGVLQWELEPAIVQDVDREALAYALLEIVDGDPQAAMATSAELTRKGCHQGRRLLVASAISEFGIELLESLATMYVLITLIPSEHGGKRVVIKYSHHAKQELDGMSLWQRWLGAAGLRPLELSFELSHPTGSASHHLEIGVPVDLECPALRLPGRHRDRNTQDASVSGSAHAAANFTTKPDGPAVAEFTVPWRGMRATAWLVAMTSFAIMHLGIALPGAQNALLDASDGAGALLLAVPAVAVVLAVGRRESAVESVLLDPLRVSMLVCALLLFACSGSIVGWLHEPWRTALWVGGSAVSAALSGLLCSRELGLMLKRRVWVATIWVALGAAYVTSITLALASR